MSMKTQNQTHGYQVLVQTADSYVMQCLCCTKIEVKYKNIMLAFEWADLVTFLQRLNLAPPNELCYLVEIVNMQCYPALKVGVSSSGIFLTINELDEFKNLLTTACERMDLELIFRNTIMDN